jgi:hypothetical protein
MKILDKIVVGLAYALLAMIAGYLIGNIIILVNMK